jgi:DNA-binding SARP family transcriptional activator
VAVPLQPEHLRIRVLGALEVEGIDDRELGSRKARLLVAALAAAGGRAVPLDVLEEVVWPEGPPSRPVEQLQVLVSRLRRALGTDRIVRTDAGYRLRADWVDVIELEARVTEADNRLRSGSLGGARAAAEAAMDLASGPLVPDVDAPWFDDLRATTARTVARGRQILAETALATGDPSTAAAAAEAVLDHDGYDEAALRTLMRAHVAAGRPASALAAYARTRQRLGEELGVDPAPETESLHTSILMGNGPRVADPEPAPPTLVGRDGELVRLRQAFDRSADGPAVGVVVEGEAGIGKTAVVTAFAAAVRRLGAVVLTGRCDPLARDLPLEPLLGAVEQHARRLASGSTGAPAGPETARLIGVLDAADASSRSNATLVDDFEAGQASLFRDLLAVLERAAGGLLPAVLVVEDLHLADAATVAFLGFALRRGERLLVVATRRPEGPGDLPGAERLTLGPLTLDDARRLVGDRAGGLVERSGGNPLFLLELADAEPGELPRSIVEAVQRRAASLGDGAPVVAGVAALGPRPVDLDLLQDVLGLPVGVLLDHLDGAVRAGFLVDDGRQLGFGHEVVREALSATLTSARRAHLHRAAAAALARRSVVDPNEVAWHARLGGDDDLAAAALVQAASLAASRFDTAEALRLIGDAIHHRDSVEARLLRARVCISSWDLERAAADVARAIDLGGGPVAMETAGWVAYYHRDYPEARRCAEEGAARATDPEVRASCLALAGRCHHTMGAMGTAADSLEDAVATGPATTRPVAQIWLAAVRNHQGRPEAGLELAAAGLIDPLAVGHPFGVVHGHFAESLSLGMLGRPLEALAELDVLEAAVEGTDLAERFLGMAANCRAWVLRWLGAFEEADDLNRRAAASPIRPTTAEFHYVGVLDLVEGRLLAGDLSGADDLLAGIAEIATFGGSMAWRVRDRGQLYRARLALASGDAATAAAIATDLAEQAGARGSRRHELFARLVAMASGEPTQLDGLSADLTALESVAGLEAWWYAALVGRARHDPSVCARAARMAATLADAAGERAPGLRAWAGQLLDDILD